MLSTILVRIIRNALLVAGIGALLLLNTALWGGEPRQRGVHTFRGKGACRHPRRRALAPHGAAAIAVTGSAPLRNARRLNVSDRSPASLAPQAPIRWHGRAPTQAHLPSISKNT